MCSFFNRHVEYKSTKEIRVHRNEYLRNLISDDNATLDKHLYHLYSESSKMYYKYWTELKDDLHSTVYFHW